MLRMLFLNVTSSIFRTFCVIYLYRQHSVDFGWAGTGNLPFAAALAVANRIVSCVYITGGNPTPPATFQQR